MSNRIIGLLTIPALLVGGGVACDYEAPLNPDYEPTNTIAGTIVADGVTDTSTAWVFIFDAKAPPPPVGTGTPVTFSIVSGDAFTGDQAGIQSAPYAVPYLADTTAETGFEQGYLVTVLMDTDGNFNPFADALGGSTCTDWLGEHKATLSDPYPVPVFVEGGELKDDVTITINRQNSSQRPAFAFDIPAGDPWPVMSKEKARAFLYDEAGNLQGYSLVATSIHTEYPAECPKGEACEPLSLDLEGPCESPCAGTIACVCADADNEPCQTGFPVRFVDVEDNASGDPVPDGLQDDYPAELQAANGIKDTWPRIYLDYMGVPASDADGNTIFENDLAEFEWPPGSGRFVGERWVAENYPFAGDLRFLTPALIGADPADPFATFRAQNMNITFSPAFRHYHEGGTYAVDLQNGPWDLYDLRCYATPQFGDGQFPSGDPYAQHPATCVPGQPVEADDVPSGAWQLILITQAGQTWRIPNEIGLPAWAYAAGLEAPLVSTDTPDFDTATQGGYLLIE